jgi:hypothetical protein
MSSLGKSLKHHISAYGKFTKILTIIYALLLLILFSTIINMYSNNSKHPISWILLVLGLGLSYFPVFISFLQNSVYAVAFFGRKQRKRYLERLDERQLLARQQIFEKSYILLATLILLATFFGVSWFGNNMSQNGAYLLALNVLMFVLALPSLVAVWDKSPVTHNVE